MKYPSPYLRLVASVMLEAVKDFRDGKRDAIAWFKSDEGYPFSFCWCCDVLDMSAESVRAAINSPNFSSSIYKMRLKTKRMD